MQTGHSMSLGWQGQGRPDFPAVAVLRVDTGAMMRQACTAADIDPDAPFVGIPAAAFVQLFPTEDRKRMKALEDKNRRLKRMFADLSMQADLLRKAPGKK